MYHRDAETETEGGGVGGPTEKKERKTDRGGKVQ